MVTKPAQTIADRVTLSRRYVRSTDVAQLSSLKEE